ncbi:YcnI family protein, partial [Mesorhizobium sp. M2A.F.Ca.ET.039.01.1.1]|uniref:YcnI family protein n=1 Tax=Mesorhizobium sp. M2A.F.Ca.ET.039.01.1.1 TaxID=2496746 RepID=UPI000FCCCF9B
MTAKLGTALRIALTAAAVAAAQPASAHITFEAKEVKAGTSARFVLRVPHGCTGSATVAVRISIPEGLSEAKPQPKPGWTLDIVSAGPETTASTEAGDDAHASQHDAAVKEISWSGRLEDARHDEFIFRAKVDAAAAGKDLFVPVVQQC